MGESNGSHDDEMLLARARAGEEEAWRMMVERLYPGILKIVRNHLRRVADHEDVVQEVLLKAFLKLDTYRSEQPLEHWIARISVTTCIDWLRKIKARPMVVLSDLSEAERALVTSRVRSEPVDEEYSEENRLAMRALLDKLISVLKPNQQIVIRMLDLEQRTVKEVTGLTGWGESKVKVTAMRARRKLEELLQELEISTSAAVYNSERIQ